MLSKFGAGHGVRLLTAVSAGALVVAGLGLAALPAGAAEKTFTDVSCPAHVTGDLTLDTTVKNSFTLNVTSPTEANAGSNVTITIVGGDTPLPASNAGPPPVTINSFTDLSNEYVVSGGSIVAGSLQASGAPKNNGNPVTGSATIQGNKIVESTPGPLNPGTLTTPTVTFKVHAGAPGSTITVTPGNVTLTTALTVTGTALHLNAAVTCKLADVDNNTLTTTQVVTPPPPGAPDAVADVASTKHNTPVTINVLKNDKPNVDIGYDPDSLAITANPKHGTAAFNADHTVTYTPNDGFSGIDDFDYKLCSLPQEIQVPTAKRAAAVDGPACDTATVTVDVAAAPVVTTTTTVATQGSTVPAATVAPAAELPRTGNSSTPLALIGAGLLGLGLVAVRGTRRRHA
jgi:LPXTG-motif cell wall-anchored protein